MSQQDDFLNFLFRIQNLIEISKNLTVIFASVVHMVCVVVDKEQNLILIFSHVSSVEIVEFLLVVVQLIVVVVLVQKIEFAVEDSVV